MTDYYLKAVSETALKTALQSAGLYDQTDGYKLASMTHGLAVVGLLYDVTVSVDANGEQVVTSQLITGFHANLRLLSGTLPSALTSLVIPTPKTPSVMWA